MKSLYHIECMKTLMHIYLHLLALEPEDAHHIIGHVVRLFL